MSRLLSTLSVFAVLFLVIPQPAQASELKARMKSLAGKIAILVKDKQQKTVAIGEFTGPPAHGSNSGPGLQQRLIDELAQQSVTIDTGSFLVVKGEYFSIPGKDKDGAEDEETVTLRLVLTVRDTKSNRLGEFSDELPSGKPGTNEIVANTLPVMTELGKHKKATEEDRNKKIKADMLKPPLLIDGVDVKTTDESPFAVNVRVRRKGQKEFDPVKPTNKDNKGRAFIDLKAGDVYRLVLTNTSSIEAVATVTIDGVNAYEFYEPADRRPGGGLIAKESKREFKGWRRSTSKSTEFLVGKFADSENAKLLKGSALLGTIVVSFHHCWEGDKVPDAYKGGRSANRLGTGQGDEIKEESKIVKRTIGPLHTAIVIRYSK